MTVGETDDGDERTALLRMLRIINWALINNRRTIRIESLKYIIIKDGIRIMVGLLFCWQLLLISYRGRRTIKGC